MCRKTYFLPLTPQKLYIYSSRFLFKILACHSLLILLISVFIVLRNKFFENFNFERSYILLNLYIILILLKMEKIFVLNASLFVEKLLFSASYERSLILMHAPFISVAVRELKKHQYQSSTKALSVQLIKIDDCYLSIPLSLLFCPRGCGKLHLLSTLRENRSLRKSKFFLPPANKSRRKMHNSVFLSFYISLFNEHQIVRYTFPSLASFTFELSRSKRVLQNFFDELLLVSLKRFF